MIGWRQSAGRLSAHSAGSILSNTLVLCDPVTLSYLTIQALSRVILSELSLLVFLLEHPGLWNLFKLSILGELLLIDLHDIGLLLVTLQIVILVLRGRVDRGVVGSTKAVGVWGVLQLSDRNHFTELIATFVLSIMTMFIQQKYFLRHIWLTGPSHRWSGIWLDQLLANLASLLELLKLF